MMIAQCMQIIILLYLVHTGALLFAWFMHVHAWFGGYTEIILDYQMCERYCPIVLRNCQDLEVRVWIQEMFYC